MWAHTQPIQKGLYYSVCRCVMSKLSQYLTMIPWRRYVRDGFHIHTHNKKQVYVTKCINKSSNWHRIHSQYRRLVSYMHRLDILAKYLIGAHTKAHTTFCGYRFDFSFYYCYCCCCLETPFSIFILSCIHSLIWYRSIAFAHYIVS